MYCKQQWILTTRC